MRVNHAQLPRPLEGVVVLDLTSALAGPYATLLLAGLGARVIKIENPQQPDTARNNVPFVGREGVAMTRRHDDDLSLAILERGRNKESITLNLKHARGREIFLALAAKADVVVENYSAGVARRLGIDYDSLAPLNPRLVYTAISGFGADSVGPQQKAMDTIVQALSGLMATSGAEGDPPVRVGAPFGDLSAPLFAVIGTLAAILQARSTGRGQMVDVSLLGAITAIVAAEPFAVMRSLGQEVRTGNTMPRLAPFGVFATRDGHVAICAPTDAFAHALYQAMDRPELAADARFATRQERVNHHMLLHALVTAWTCTQDSSAVVQALEGLGVPCGLVRDPADAVRDPRLLARGETEVVEHPRYGAVGDIVVGGLPMRLSGAFTGFDRAAPTLGQHNAAVLREFLGLSQAELDGLQGLGVV
jgi:CoA:oxalate CoA-transferase